MTGATALRVGETRQIARELELLSVCINCTIARTDRPCDTCPVQAELDVLAGRPPAWMPESASTPNLAGVGVEFLRC